MITCSCFGGVLAVLMVTLALSAGVAHAQPADRFATVNGLRIHYLEWGTSGKQPMILLHGIGRVAHAFDHLAPHFSKSYYVIAVDMRGHGDSDWDPQGNYLVEDYVRDIEGLVAQLKLRNIVLWGNSTGGRVAQVFAGLHPDLVSAVIAEDVGPERPREISDRRATRMSQEEKGWASLDELLAQLKKDNPLTSEQVLRNLAQYGSKQSADGRIVWKRDPGDRQRVRADRAVANRPADQSADHLYSGRSEHHRSGGNAGAAQASLAAGPDRHDAGAGSLSQRREARGFPGDRGWISCGKEGRQIDLQKNSIEVPRGSKNVCLQAGPTYRSCANLNLAARGSFANCPWEAIR